MSTRDIGQVIAYRCQVSSNRMSSDNHSRYHYCIEQYRKTVLIQERSTNIWDNGTDTKDLTV